MPFESKESIRRVHSVVDKISASVSLRESQSANLNLENNSLILLKWMQKPSSKSFESTQRRFKSELGNSDSKPSEDLGWGKGSI